MVYYDKLKHCMVYYDILWYTWYIMVHYMVYNGMSVYGIWYIRE